jgi:hypothetical protein
MPESNLFGSELLQMRNRDESRARAAPEPFDYFGLDGNFSVISPHAMLFKFRLWRQALDLF